MKETKINLKNFLEYLITPQDDKEQSLFKSKELVDEYIKLNKKIPLLNKDELIKEINIQLLPYKLKINKVCKNHH